MAGRSSRHMKRSTRGDGRREERRAVATPPERESCQPSADVEKAQRDQECAKLSEQAHLAVDTTGTRVAEQGWHVLSDERLH